MSTRNAAIVLTARKIMDIGTGMDGSLNVKLGDDQIGEEVDAAVVQYSADRPRIVVVNLTGNGTSFYDRALLTSWVEDWSQVTAIEYPAAAVSATHVPTWLQSEDWTEYRSATVKYLRLPNHTPTASETVRVAYTTLHSLTASVDTLPTAHYDAVCDLAASFCSQRLATKAAAAGDSTINADSTNQRDGQLRFKQQASEFQAQYRRKVGLPEDGAPAISKTFDWDSAPSAPWLRDRFFHPARWR